MRLMKFKIGCNLDFYQPFWSGIIRSLLLAAKLQTHMVITSGSQASLVRALKTTQSASSLTSSRLNARLRYCLAVEDPLN